LWQYFKQCLNYFNDGCHKNHKTFNLHVNSQDLTWNKKHCVGATSLNYMSTSIFSSRKSEKKLLFQRYEYGATTSVTLHPKANVRCHCKKKHVAYILTFRGPCIVIYSYNKIQQNTLFLNFILLKNSTCFGQIYCPSSGVLILSLK
jgi:hypothetical protein